MRSRRISVFVVAIAFVCFKGVILSAAKDPEEFHAAHTLTSFRCTKAKGLSRKQKGDPKVSFSNPYF
jgi:hypothetical protein